MIARKLMLLGDMGVGKTSLARRLVFKAFEQSYKPTIGVDIYRYLVELPAAGDRQAESVELIIWDTDGDIGENIFRHVYLQGATGALIVADSTRRKTLDSMVRLAEGFDDALPGRPYAMVINKADLIVPGADPDLPSQLQRARAPLVRTSALTGDNVAETFADIAKAIVRRSL